MCESYRKDGNGSVPMIQIPPLDLTSGSFTPNHQKQKSIKELAAFLPKNSIDQDANFLKEKSLYRYAISRKLSRSKQNKSQTFFLPSKSSSFSTDIQMEMPTNKEAQSAKQKSLVLNTSQGDLRQPHFRRKSRNNNDLTFSRNPHRQNLPVNFYGNQVDKNNNFNKDSSYSFAVKQGISMKNVQVAPQGDKEMLRKELQTYKKQNQTLRRKLQQKTEALDRKTQQNLMINQEKNRLFEEKRRLLLFHSEDFVEQNKLTSQLANKDQLIQQLQAKIKYMQVQILTLKKNKVDKSRHVNLIARLQQRNEELQSKIKSLTVIVQMHANKNIKASRISECSDISFNFSVDDEQKMMEGLKTAEGTPIRTRATDRKEYYTTNEGRFWDAKLMV